LTSPFLPGGRKPLRQFSGNAQEVSPAAPCGFEINPDCGEIIEVTAEAKAGAGSLKRFGVG